MAQNPAYAGHAYTGPRSRGSGALVWELGKGLAEIRKRIVVSGVSLVTWDEIGA